MRTVNVQLTGIPSGVTTEIDYPGPAPSFDLTAPGAVEQLLAVHRATFGDARMEDATEGESKDKTPEPPAYTPPATQADLDRIIGERLARERAKYADYPDLKAKAEKFDEAIENAKTEQQKAVDAARKEGASGALEAANGRLVAAEARALAAAGSWRISPAAVVKQLDLAGVKVADDGTVDQAAIKTALDDLAKTEPGLLDDGKGAKPKPDPSQGSKGGDSKPSVSAGRDLYAATRKTKT